MLAYELYWNNKDSRANNPRGDSQPIKKIFFQKDKSIITRIETYSFRINYYTI